MRHNPGILLAIAGIANAVPHPQFNLPFSLPSFSLPTGSAGSGSGNLRDILARLPSATGAPEIGSGSSPSWADLFGGGFGSGLSDLLSGGRSGSGNGPTNPTESTLIQVTATPTRAEETAAPTRSAEGAPSTSGTIGSDCSPQGSSGGLGGTENGVLDKNCCTDMTVIFARGTGEFGNVGTVSGPPMFKAIRAKLGAGRVTVQGVDYPASSAGNANMGGDGGKIMAQLVGTALSQCPNTTIIVSGYSQGAMVVHNAFRNGLASSQVSGAILFGDPLKRSAVGDLPTDKVKQFCGTSDTICGGGGDGGATGGHISYGSVADSAADFAIQAAGLS